MKKVRPFERKRKLFEEALSIEGETILEAWHRHCRETMIQESLEAEVADFFGRKWYEHGQKDGFKKEHRNGYYPKQVKTVGGVLSLDVPRVRNTREPFVSKILRCVAYLSGKLEQLAMELYVRGLSTRDIEAALVDQEGNALLSRSAVSRLNEGL